jgi:hypothetical protein
MKCNRCNKKTNVWILSMFNTEEICMDCKAEEKQLPEYEKAVKADMKEIKKGNYNFQGIGFPKK